MIRAIEFEVDSIDELVLILKESEQSDMLRRIGYCRKRMMGLLRLLSSKTDVVKTLIKRGEMAPEDGTRPALSKEVALYLGDVQGKFLLIKEKVESCVIRKAINITRPYHINVVIIESL